MKIVMVMYMQLLVVSSINTKIPSNYTEKVFNNKAINIHQLTTLFYVGVYTSLSCSGIVSNFRREFTPSIKIHDKHFNVWKNSNKTTWNDIKECSYIPATKFLTNFIKKGRSVGIHWRFILRTIGNTIWTIDLSLLPSVPYGSTMECVSTCCVSVQ